MSLFLKRLFKYKEKRKKVAMQRHRELLAAATANLGLIRAQVQENTALSDQISQMQVKQDQLLSEITILRNIVTSSVDITHLPPAHGDLRLIQQAGLVLLKKLDRVCRENNLSYWMDFGSLLGTVRHKGFIPWDDDMDVSMLRSDYDRLLPILEKEFCKDGFHFSKGDIIRLFYKGIPAQVDIFPYDQATETEPPVEGTAKFTELYQWMENVHWHVFQPDYSKLDTQEDTITPEHFAKGHHVFEDTFLKGGCALPNGYLFTGVETTPPQRAFFKYDWIFPLKKACFEGMDVLIPQKADLYLRQYYNDYMAFPRDCYPKHSSIMGRLNAASVADMQELFQKEAAHD